LCRGFWKYGELVNYYLQVKDIVMDCLTTSSAAYPGLTYAETLANMGNNTGLFLKLAELFIEQHSHDVDHIEQALSRGDRERARQLTHALRGTAGNLGAINLYHRVGDFEPSIEQKPDGTKVPNDVKQAMTELLSSLATLVSDLSHQVAVSPTGR